MDNQPVTFPNWKQALAGALPVPAVQAAYVREIITFLKYCKTNHVPATVLLAKHYVETQERLRPGPVREALRWFFRAAKQAAGRDGPERDGAGAPLPRNPEGEGRALPVERSGGVPASRPLRPMQPKRAKDDVGETDICALRAPLRFAPGPTLDANRGLTICALRAACPVQELLGHASVETMQIYTHVMRKPGLGVRSPLDALRPAPPDPTCATGNL